MDSLFGKRYILHDELGKGGMGVVFRATDRLTGRKVALKQVLTPTNKLLFRGMSEMSEEKVALGHEFQTMASLRHPYIISVLDYGFEGTEGIPFYTMELMVEPMNLLAAARRLAVEAKIHLILQILQALAYLHRRGIFHRDLKPANVLVENRQLKVLDFGLAVNPEDQPEGVVGTLPYMAPEVLQSRPASRASDLYAVGVMAYELLVGHHPFETNSIMELVDYIINTEPNLNVLETLYYDSQQLKRPSPEASEPSDPETVRLDPEKLDKFHELLPDPEALERIKRAQADHKRKTHTDIERAKFITPGGYLAAVLGRLLAKKPEERYQDAWQVIEDFNEVLRHPVPLENKEIRESFLQAAAFVGRQREMLLLETAMIDAKREKGSAWLVAGESGVGKSRLMDELRIKSLVKGLTVLTGQAVNGGGLPYNTWRLPLRHLVLTTTITDHEAAVLEPLIPDIDDLIGRDFPDIDPLEGQDAQKRLITTISGIFRRLKQPTLIILEDLHWVNESIEVLKALLPLATDIPLLIVGTYRKDERNLKEELPDMEVIPLDPLDEDGIADLSASILGEDVGRREDVLSFLCRETEGNAFFLVEVVRALAEDAGGLLSRIGLGRLPDKVFAGGIQEVVQKRLSRLSENARALVRIAAIIGRQLNLTLLEEVAHRAKITLETGIDAWLIDCANAAIFDVHQDQWRFVHDKLLEGALEELDTITKPSLHRHIAEAIESIYTDATVYAAALTRHWHEAGNEDKESFYAIAAGKQRFQISAYREAIGFFERALELNADNPREVAYLKRKLGEAHERINEFTVAQKYLEESLANARKLKTQAEVARALIGLSEVERMRGEFPNAQRHLEEGLVVARSLNDPAITAYVLNGLGTISWLQGQYIEAKEYNEEALQISRAMNDRALIAASLRGLGNIAYFLNEYEDSKTYLQESIALFKEIGNRDSMGRAITVLGELERTFGEFEKARKHYEESLAIFKEIGAPGSISVILLNLGMVEIALNEFKKAENYVYQALELSMLSGSTVYVLSALLLIAGLFEKNSDKVKAVELLSVVLSHPATYQEHKDEAQASLIKLEKELPKDKYLAAFQSGQNLNIETIIDELLSK